MSSLRAKHFKMRSDPKRLLESLVRVKKICDKHNLSFWLNYGALLGVVR